MSSSTIQTRLFNSVVQVHRLQLVVPEEGDPYRGYALATDPDPRINAKLAFLRCRLDMNYLREGKDAPPQIVAGKAPERVGVLFAPPDAPLKAGDRVVAIRNVAGVIPVPGIFDIRVQPDIAQGMAIGHHLEVQIVESAQRLTDDNSNNFAPLPDPESEAL